MKLEMVFKKREEHWITTEFPFNFRHLLEREVMRLGQRNHLRQEEQHNVHRAALTSKIHDATLPHRMAPPSD